MTKKMKLRVDLRTLTGTAQVKDQSPDKVKALEQRLDGYIQQFINMNAHHQEILDKTHEKLGEDYARKMELFEARL